MKQAQTFRIVARTEMLLCLRSWVFRLYMLVVLVGLGIANVVMFMPDAIGQSLVPWTLRAVPSSVPYFNVLMLTMTGSLFITFSAIDSFRRERSLNSAASLHTRDFINAGYVAGKAIGIIASYFILQVVVLALVYAMNSAFMTDVPVDTQVYLLYPFIIGFPALVFIAGLSFTVATVFKHTAAVMLLLIGVVLVPFFIVDGLIARVLDYNAIHLPLLYSDFVGFGNTGDILLHRVWFLLMGLGLIIWSALRFDRLPQSTVSRKRTGMSASVLMVTGVVACVAFLWGMIGDQRLRDHMQALNKEYVAIPHARMTACQLDVTHQGSSLTVTAEITLENRRDVPLDRTFLSLNPGLSIDDITADGISLDYRRDTQIIDIALSTPLEAGESCDITVSYHGAPDDHAMYPDIAADEHLSMNRLFTHVIDKRHAFVTPRYVLLTPESLWYPVSGIPYGMVFPDAYEKDFVDFTLDVTTGDGLTVVSQGEVTEIRSGEFTVRPETKLTGLTLIAGEYEKRSHVIPGNEAFGSSEVELCLYTKPGHDYFMSYFSGQEDGFQYMQTQMITLESIHGTFPYQSYLFVEVPVQFYAYNRVWGMPTETMQPQMNLLLEKGSFIPQLDLRRIYESTCKRFIDRGQPLEANDIANNMVNHLNNLVFQVMMPIASNNMYIKKTLPLFDNLDSAYIPWYSTSQQYGPFMHSIESVDDPVLAAVIEQYHSGPSISPSELEPKALTADVLACMNLQKGSFREYLKDADDQELTNVVLEMKADQLFAETEVLVGFGGLNDFINDFFDAHRFENVTVDMFISSIDSVLGIDFNKIVDRWSNCNELPCYEVSEVEVAKIEHDEFPYYYTTLTITNITSVPGIVIVMGGSRKTILIEGNQSVLVGIETDRKPTYTSINTLVSQNIPRFVQRRYSGSPPVREIETFDGVRIIEYQLQTDKPGIILVDNLDPGFEIVADTPDNPGIDEYGFGDSTEDFIFYKYDAPPLRWGKAVINSAFGVKETAYYTRSGPGDRQARWTANISETGWYDLEYYIPDITGLGRPEINAQFIGEHTLIVRQNSAEHQTELSPGEETGWLKVSSLELEPGPVEVLLTNESDGTLIYADAIRWVKK